MALSSAARTFSVLAPTEQSKRTIAASEVKRTVKAAASAETVHSERLASRRDIAKSAFLAAPLVAGMVPSSAHAAALINGPAAGAPEDLDDFFKGIDIIFSKDSTGIGSDGLNAFAIFKYIVPSEQATAFEKAFADVKKAALNANPPIPGIVEFTYFQEAEPTLPGKPNTPFPTTKLTYYSTAIFKTEQQGRDFIATPVGKDFIKQILSLGVKFLPNGAVFKG